MLSVEQTQYEFILRRAWRRGEVRLKEIQSLFGLSKSTAIRRLRLLLDPRKHALEGRQMGWKFQGPEGQPYLIKQGQAFIPNPDAPEPACGSTEDLQKYLFLVHDPGLFYTMTGLHPEEIALNHYPWINVFPENTQVFKDICQSLMKLPNKERPCPLEITYVSLQQGEHGKRSVIIPLSLQLVNSQVSVYAWRVCREEFGELKPCKGEPRTFVLSRILNCRPHPIKRSYLSALPHQEERPTTYQVELNPLLTSEQRSILKHELNVPNLEVRLPSAIAFQFFRLYADEAAKGVWPPISIRKES